MSVIKIVPDNLSDIQKHFRKTKLDIVNKLTAAHKKRRKLDLEISSLEKESTTCDSGIKWCEEVYKAVKRG